MMTTRLSAAALLVGSVGLICEFLLAAATGAEQLGSPGGVPINVLSAVAGIIALLGFPALLAGHPRRGRALTIAGYVGIFAITAYTNVFIALTMAIVLPWADTQGVATARGPQIIGAIFVVLAVAQVVFTALLAAGALRAGRRLAGWILVVSAVLALTSAAPLPEFVATTATVLLFAGIAVIAARGVSRTVSAEARPRATSAQLPV